MRNLLIDLACKKKITDVDIQDALYEICEQVHSHCDEECPVYHLNGGVPDTAKNFEINRGCDCFKSGSKMLDFIRDLS